MIDCQREHTARVTLQGDEVPSFKLHISGFLNGQERKMSLTHRDKVSYTPHQNKFHGYCQFPNQKLNEKKLTESKVTLKQKYSTRSVNRSTHTVCEMNGQLFNTKHSELLFQKDTSHLSANLQDVMDNMEKSTIQSFVFRKGCTKLLNRKELQQRDQSNRFVSKYINHRQVKSPPVPLINKFIVNLDQQKLQNEQFNQTETNKLTLPQDRGRITICDNCDDSKSRSLSKSLYQTLDISLQGDTIEGNYMKTINTDIHQKTILSDLNRYVSEIYQSFSFKSKMSGQQQLITVKNQQAMASQLDRELDLYPDVKQPHIYKQPRQYRTKISTELELSKRDRELNTNYFL